MRNSLCKSKITYLTNACLFGILIQLLVLVAK